jgi:two-component system response regulator YesN
LFKEGGLRVYQLLVVDDEKYAVQAIKECLDWKSLGISEVFEANSVKQAIDIICNEQIDLLITDIEMPGRSGLDLAEWTSKNYAGIPITFLTGHDDFDYACQGIRLGVHEYLLKPVDKECLDKSVTGMIDTLRKRSEDEHYQQIYNNYVHLWERQKPALSDRFWRDVLTEKETIDLQEIACLFQLYDIPLRPGGHVLPVLIVVEHWQKELSKRDKVIMEYALRKAAAEVVLLKDRGAVIQVNDGQLVALLYGPDDIELKSLPINWEIEERCSSFIKSCKIYFKCSLSCYIGESVEISSLAAVYRRLLHAERNSVSNSAQVVRLDERPFETRGGFSLYPVTRWQAMLESGNGETLQAEILGELNELGRKEKLNAETIEALYHTLVHLVYTAAHKKGIAVSDIFADRNWLVIPITTGSISHLSGWCKKVIETSSAYFLNHCKEESIVINKLKQMIRERYSEDLNRDMLASNVFLNAGYVSRLFKRETGYSLSDYIATVRMEEAKRLLNATQLKISAVAEAVGYSHFSHFAQQFKKHTSYTPQEFRKLVE